MSWEPPPKYLISKIHLGTKQLAYSWVFFCAWFHHQQVIVNRCTCTLLEDDPSGTNCITSGLIPPPETLLVLHLSFKKSIKSCSLRPPLYCNKKDSFTKHKMREIHMQWLDRSQYLYNVHTCMTGRTYD